MIDFEPSTSLLAALVDKVADGRLAARTPCGEYSLGDLLDHVQGFPLAFTAGARKEPDVAGGVPDAHAAGLGADWRPRIGARLATLAAAWAEPAAWTGEATVAGFTGPGEVHALFALNEVVVHGWDVAKASGQDYVADPAALSGLLAFAARTTAAELGPDGPFGPVVAVPDDAPPLDRLLGLRGRDPHWTAG